MTAIRTLTAMLVLTLPVLGAAAQPVPALPPDLDAVVARTLRAFEVPGLALAVVKDSRVLLTKGYGVRRLGAAAPVDAQT